MRNPKRIYTVMNLVEQIWEAYPDTRFFQLMENLKYDFHNKTKRGERIEFEKKMSDGYIIPDSKIDLFHVEDEELILFLKEKVREIEESKEGQ